MIGNHIGGHLRAAVVPLWVGAAAVLSSAVPPEASRHAEAPPTGHTGGFGEPTCLECHVEFPLNAPGGSVLILGLPDVYEPGRPYPLTVRLESEEMAKAGFQLSARFGSGDGVGTAAGLLRPMDGRVAVTRDSASTVPYAHHTRAGTPVGDPALATWTLEWIAPGAGADVVFHVAANSANGDDSPLGDLVYAAAARARATPER